MVEYFASEELDARTFELCETCEQKSKPGEHLCAAMRLDDRRVEAAFRNADYEKSRRALTCLMQAQQPSAVPFAVKHLPTPWTIGDLCQWASWDLWKVTGIGRTTTNVTKRALKRAGLSLRDVTFQKAAADRRKAMRAAQRQRTDSPSISEGLKERNNG